MNRKLKPYCPLLGLIIVLSCSVTIAGAADRAESILAETGVQGGLVVHLGCGDGTLTAQLHQSDSFLVLGLDTDRDNVELARQYVRQKKLYGPVSIDQFDGRQLPLIDNSVTLVVADRTTVPMREIMRVLHPHGIALVDSRTTVKPKPDDIDEWTHYLHSAGNNAVAHDSVVGPPRHMQFLAAPLWSRHHDRLASISSVVTAKGRMFYIIDNGPVFDAEEAGNWSITARNAFNGVFLWQKPISTWTDISRKFRSGPVQLQRLLVTDGDRVYVTLGLDQAVSVLDAGSGKEITVLQGTEKAEEFVLLDGVLFVQIGTRGAEHALIEQRRTAPDDYLAAKVIKAVDVQSGQTRWQWPAAGTATIMPRTLAAVNGQVYCQERGDTVCLDAQTGQPLWRTPEKSSGKTGGKDSVGATGASKRAKQQKGQKRKNAKAKQDQQSRTMGWTYATLVVHDDVVLSCDGATLLALDAASGNLLWECPAKTPFGKVPSVDILVVNQVVWTSPDLDVGRALRTGEVVQSTKLSEELVTAGHHHRCYRNKATDRYVIQGYRGLEFRDTQGNDHCRHNWIRGICQYGIMPANGMVYLPPHNCGCYPEARLFGLWALKANESSFDLDALEPGSVLEKGPAYPEANSPLTPVQPLADSGQPSSDWPMYRHDPQRSGTAGTAISVNRQSWAADGDSPLSAPVIADGMLLVAAADTHQVWAFDALRGDPKWSFAAAGPIDSPPTMYGDLTLFGSADGCVYCLRLTDGSLVWKFRAAPADLRTVSLQQIESLWPVHGSILVSDGIAYFTAGRSSYVDGGIFLYGLDPLTGEIRYQQRLSSSAATELQNTSDIERQQITQNATDYKTQLSPDQSDAFSMSGNISDILVSDDNAIYLRHMKFDKQLKPQSEWTHHLFSTSTLLDPNEAHRSHWFYGNGDFSRLPVAYEWLTRNRYGGFASPLGKLLVIDQNRLWGSGWGTMALYTTDVTDIDRRVTKDFPRDDGTIVHQGLAETLPIHPRAMLKAADKLYLAGYPVQSNVRHVYGQPIKDLGLLLEIDAASGAILQQLDLPASPRFDGMAAAGGRLYLTLENNQLMCLE